MKHLEDKFEKLRKQIIKVNDNINEISENCIKNSEFYNYSEEEKAKLMNDFLVNQDALNKLHRDIINNG